MAFNAKLGASSTGNFKVKFENPTSDITLRNQGASSVQTANASFDADTGVITFTRTNGTTFTTNISDLVGANTSVANVSLSSNTLSFSREDGSTFSADLSNLTANTVAFLPVQDNLDFKVAFVNHTGIVRNDYQLLFEGGGSQFTYNPSTNRLNVGTLGSSYVVTSLFQIDNQSFDRVNRSVETWEAIDQALPTSLAIENRYTTNTAFQSYVANTNPRIAKFNANGDVSGHLIPSANVTYDLGSPTRAFRSLYVSGNTIFIANNRISTDGNTISFVTDTGTNAKIEAGAVTIKDILGDAAKDIILKASNGIFRTVQEQNGTETELDTKFEILEVRDTATISNLVLQNVLGTQYGGTGLSSVTENGVLIGKSSSELEYITGSTGNLFQVAANGTPTFDDLDGGTY